MDLFKFPFHADVWGTASEWTMICVTSITAIFLYRTLKSQQAIQIAQIKLLEIEQVRLREELKPKLRFSRIDDATAYNSIPKENLKDKELVSFAISNLSENPALQVKPDYHHVQGAEVWVNPLNPINLDGTQDYISLHFLVNRQPGEYLTYVIIFTIIYNDKAGSRYRQEVACFMSPSQDERIIPNVPSLID